MSPKLNRKRALFVLTKIDEILAWEKQKDAERDTRFVELGRYLCEVRAGQYWRLEKLRFVRRFSGATVPGIEKEGVLPDVHPRAPAAGSTERSQGNRLDERAGVGEAGAARRSELRLCTLGAQSARNAERGLQARGGEGTDGKASGAIGANLLQALPEPDLGY